MKIIAALAAAAAAFALFSSAASAETINCPLSQATRSIQESLPAGWWTTPVQSNLSETKMFPIGGKQALVCVYGPSGSVQREAPPNSICTTNPTGFECKPKFVIAPGVLKPGVIVMAGVHKSGSLVVPQTYLFDIDNGSVGGSAGADLWFEAKTATARFLTPRNGATIWVGDRSARTKAQCEAGAYTANATPMFSVPPGSYVCVKTNEGRVGIVKIVQLTGLAVKNLEIEYTTWN